MNTIYSAFLIPEQATRVDVFESIFLVFLGLGTLVGIVVVAYTLYNAYKYRDAGDAKPDDSLPTLGELPTGGKGGKKLFLSFGISAIIVISLVIWTYGMLLYVEDPNYDEFDGDPVEIEVEGDSFNWFFEYENGHETAGTMTIPEDRPVQINVTAGDVWHTFGVTDLRVKADAIPGEYDQTWFVAEETGEHEIECFELCGDFHSDMTGTVEVVSEEEFEEYLEENDPDAEEDETDDEEEEEETEEDEEEVDEDEDEEGGDDE